MFDFIGVQNFKWGVQFKSKCYFVKLFFKIQYITPRDYGSIKWDKFVINVSFKPWYHYLKILQDNHLVNVKYN
jgi:hypothetical protein